MPNKTTKRIIIERIVELTIVLILIGLSNLYIPLIKNNNLNEILHFFNQNAKLIIVIFILAIIVEISFLKSFPFNFLGPIFASMCALTTAVISINLIIFLDALYKLNVLSEFEKYKMIIYIIIIILTLIIGYIALFKNYLDELDSKESYANNQNTILPNASSIPVQTQVAQNNPTTVLEAYKQALISFAKSLKTFFDTRVKK